MVSPVDAAKKAMDLLGGHRIESVIADESSADLEIILEGNVHLRTFGDSSGYEAWHIDGKMGITIVAQGDGNIVVFNERKKA